jgi:hypothetical protein
MKLLFGLSEATQFECLVFDGLPITVIGTFLF